MEKVNSARLLSLDVLRGITIAGMMLVNNPGSWSYVYAPLAHAPWDGLTPTDLVFPFFVFIMGVSMYLSYKKMDFRLSKDSFVKLTRRSVLLFLIGLAMGYLGLSMRQYNALRSEDLAFTTQLWQAMSSLENLRIMGVLQRLALISFFGTLSILLVRPRFIPWLAGGLLVIYWGIIGFFDSYTLCENIIISVIDQAIFGATHMYKTPNIEGVRIVFDPEGLLSTLPCIAHVLIGFWAGKLMSESKDLHRKIEVLFIMGTILSFAGFLLDYGFPINKNTWSSSFVLTTSGLAALLLALLIWIIDIKGQKKWSVFFEAYGVNPMFVFVAGGVITILTSNIGFQYQGVWTSLKTFAYKHMLQPALGDYPGSLVFALGFVFICWLIAHYLYKKKIYIKL